MTLELDPAEHDVLRKIIGSYLSELRQVIANTQRGTGEMHAEEDLIRRIQARL